ncbi:dienelactone hydrolase family protein [Microbulbifer sp. OS29]|uniref:Dienelactone hydrolase family protein n=1 Tax=Microbulbifer okhotskensis TaxID=2926617 RepID=A0A9X2ETP2_9GAMM|nr:dienelactone hydrolase family protein [Microbulbifer okhotskensis]MCO1335601.1 dienelactone hydrolase family protein [Microbulbifer okhotskensis]
METEVIDYTVNGDSFCGYLAWDENISGKRPGILLVHEWWGHNAFIREQAEKLANCGYRAFAVDMFGAGKQTDDPVEAQSFRDEALKNPVALEARFRTALSLLQQHTLVDSKRIAAQGYCFGGGVVLTMARLGVDLRGAVSFHGALARTTPGQRETIKAEIQVYTGGADTLVPPDQVGHFVTEMQEAGAKFTLVSYPEVLHGFTNPCATERGEKFGLPLAYNREAAEDSWQGTLAFYEKLFS